MRQVGAFASIGLSRVACNGDTHAAAVRDLPDIHRDPFDRLLVAQAITDSVRLPSDENAAKYMDLVIGV